MFPSLTTFVYSYNIFVLTEFLCSFNVFVSSFWKFLFSHEVVLKSFIYSLFSFNLVWMYFTLSLFSWSYMWASLRTTVDQYSSCRLWHTRCVLKAGKLLSLLDSRKAPRVELQDNILKTTFNWETLWRDIRFLPCSRCLGSKVFNIPLK